MVSPLQVLADGYLMIGIDGSEASDGSDWFCYHCTSPSIFPSGFCDINSIQLTPPRGRDRQRRPLDSPGTTAAFISVCER